MTAKEPSPRPSAMRRLARAGLFVGWTVGVVLLTVWFFWYRGFVAGLKATARPASPAIEAVGPADADLIRDVGHLFADRASSFVQFAPEEPAGVTRLCAFGDSYTYGDEVAPDEDYPTLLQRLYAARGRADVQVINFGSSWHGFHQAFRIWDRLGRGYGCDGVLLGPGTFVLRRDGSFAHALRASPYYLHGRYVLDDDAEAGVRWVPVPGATYDERLDRYLRFFPTWDVLRYDRNAPALMQAMAPGGATIRNPFYYSSRSVRDEALELYARLIARMASESEFVVVNLYPLPYGGLGERGVDDLAERVAAPNVVFARAVRSRDLPYQAPKGHNSAWGNALLARQVLSLIEPDVPAEATVLATEPLAGGQEPTDTPSEPRPVAEYRGLEVVWGERTMGRLRVASLDAAAIGTGGLQPFAGTDAVSSLLVGRPDLGWTRAAVLPLPFPITGDEMLSLKTGDGAIELGRVSVPDPSLPIGRIATDRLRFDERQSLRWDPALDRPAGPWTIELEGSPLMEGWLEGEVLHFTPVGGATVYQFAGVPEGPPPSDGDAIEGTFDLVLWHPDVGERRLPLDRVVHEVRRFARPVRAWASR